MALQSNFLYTYLAKLLTPSKVHKLFVVIPSTNIAHVDFGSPSSVSGSQNVDTEIDIYITTQNQGQQKFYPYVYDIDLGSGAFVGDERIIIHVYLNNNYSHTVKLDYEDADIQDTIPVGKTATDAPYILLYALKTALSERHPNVLIPFQKPISNIQETPNIDNAGTKGKEHKISFTSGSGDIEWYDSQGSVKYSTGILPGNTDKDYFFTSEVSHAGKKKKGKVKDKNYVEQPSIIFIDKPVKR